MDSISTSYIQGTYQKMLTFPLKIQTLRPEFEFTKLVSPNKLRQAAAEREGKSLKDLKDFCLKNGPRQGQNPVWTFLLVPKSLDGGSEQAQVLPHRTYLLISFRKSPPPQSRQLNISISNSEQ
jgi:hypothetical protein